MENSIEMLNITKKFGNFVANEDITFKVKKNEIHALIGENGAGKSTLMNQLFGLLSPTNGSIKINGETTIMSNPTVAAKCGLGMVHQHFQLVDTHTVLENILLGREGTTPGQPINFSKARTKLLNLSKKYNLDIEPDTEIRDLTVGQQQKVEILKMLYSGAEILIFDEPTAMLTPQEIDGLLDIFRTFKKNGKTIVFISHKMAEIKAVADSFTVIRKGKWIGTEATSKKTIKQMAEMMVGRQLVEIKNQSKQEPGEVILSLEDINVRHFANPDALGLKKASFDVKAGEIVAIAGVEGNGQTELAYAISGLQKPISGQIKFKGKDITKSNPRKRYELGLSFLPEDRYKHAMFAKQNLFSNLVMQTFYKKPYSKFGFMLNAQKEKQTRDIIKTFDVRGAREGLSIIGSLSGGNQQKFIAGREMSREHDLLVLFQPTRGLDIGAIEFLHSKILEEKKNGKAVLLISYDLGEILSLSDRVVVVSGGDVIETSETSKVSREKLGEWMGGTK